MLFLFSQAGVLKPQSQHRQLAGVSLFIDDILKPISMAEAWSLEAPLLFGESMSVSAREKKCAVISGL